MIHIVFKHCWTLKHAMIMFIEIVSQLQHRSTESIFSCVMAMQKIGSAKQGKEFEELSSELLLPSALISPTAAGHLLD